MFSQRLWIAAAIVGSAWLTTAAHAQVGTGGTGGNETNSGKGGILVYLISIGGEEAQPGQNWIGLEQCRNDEVVEFKLDGAPANKLSIDIYKGENCNSVDRTNETNRRCTYLDTQNGGITQGLMIKVKASDLMDCDTPEQGKPKLWFLAVDDPGGSENVGNGYGMFDQLRTDTRPPGAPSKLTGGQGENQVPIEWDSDEIELDGFRVYVDPNPGASGSAGSGSSGSGAADDSDAGRDAGGGTGETNSDCPSALFDGASPADLPSSITRVMVDKPTATGATLTPSNVGSMRAAIAIVAVDLAGNESELSNVACVDFVKTEGFWDRYQQNGGETATGCPCSAAGPAQIESAWPVALAVLMLGLSARRRRSS